LKRTDNKISINRMITYWSCGALLLIAYFAVLAVIAKTQARFTLREMFVATAITAAALAMATWYVRVSAQIPW
jgi:hypothetical protein